MRCVSSYLLAFAAAASLVTAAPTLNYPLPDQHPPVARVGSDWVFDLLPGSFTSSQPINYTVSGLPKWCTFSSTAPTFYGSPAASDVGETPITLSASDSTGTVSSNFTLIVSKFAAPVANLDFAKQLADNSTRQFSSVKVTPANRAITVPPYWSFSLGWSGDSFRKSDKNNNGKLYYSAHVEGTTRLPEWLTFSNKTFTFTGVAPGNGTYPIVVTGTDYWGYSGAVQTFLLSVGVGATIELNGNLSNIDTVSRDALTHSLDLSNVLVNGQKADLTQITATPDLANLKWLSFDSKTNTFSGTTPDSLANGTVDPISFPITLRTTNTSNTLSYVSYLGVNVLPYAFSAFELPTMNITANQSFDFNLSSYVLNKTAPVNASVVPADAASWLVFFPENYTLIGTPPSNLSYSAINVTYQSTTAGVGSKTQMYMPISGITGPNGHGEPAPVPEGTVQHGISKKNKIIIGVVVGVFGFILLLALLACLYLCCFRKKRRDTEKQGSPDTVVGTPMKMKKADDDEPTVVGRKSRRFAVKGLFGPVVTDKIDKDRSIYSNDEASFIGSPELIHADRNRGGVSPITRPSDDGDSLSSVPSMHWSGENEYMEPLYETGDPNKVVVNGARLDGSPVQASTPSTANVVTPTLGQGSPAPRAMAEHPSDMPRPLPGFYPRYPRNLRAGDPYPRLASDDVPSSHFSEFEGDFSSSSSRQIVASRSLDSFADPGSAVGWSSHSGGRPLSNMVSLRSSSSVDSGEWFHPKESALSRLASSGNYVSGSTFCSSEPAVVATAQRESLETRRSSMIRADGSPAQSRPISYVVPPQVGVSYHTAAVPAQRQSSRRSAGPKARLHATRERIIKMSPPPTPHVPEHLASVESSLDARIRR